MLKALVVELREDIAEVLKRACDPAATHVESASGLDQAEKALLLHGAFDIVVISLDVGKLDALSLLGWARRQNADGVVICVFSEMDDRVERAMRVRGASMCLPRAWVEPRLFEVLWHVQKTKLMMDRAVPEWGRRVARPFLEEERLN